MPFKITVQSLEAQPIAAVRRRLSLDAIGGAWGPALDQVWAFLKRNPGLRSDGHNVFVYHHAVHGAQPMEVEVEFAVQVTRPFDGGGDVVSTATPAGEVVRTVADGYGTLHAAHAALHAWCTANGREFAGVAIELYGDPDPADPTRIDIEVMLLLR